MREGFESCLALIIAGFSLPVAAAQEAASVPVVEPEAEDLLRRMSALISEYEQYSFKVFETFDEVLPDGRIIQTAAVRSAFVRRPDLFATDARGDVIHRELHYDGKSLVVFDSEELVYGEADMPNTIDAMLDTCSARYGVETPTGPFVRTDPYAALTADVQRGRYLGRRLVGDKSYHCIILEGKQIDRQIWLETGNRVLPKKYVVRYKTLRGIPRYEAVFETWRSGMNLPRGIFSFTPQSDRKKIDELPFGVGPGVRPRVRETDPIR